MTREDVISWLEYLSDDARSKADSLVPTNIEIACGMAIDALKAQDPVEPKYIHIGDWARQHFECGACGAVIKRTDRYCGNCGKAVKWE